MVRFCVLLLMTGSLLHALHSQDWAEFTLDVLATIALVAFARIHGRDLEHIQVLFLRIVTAIEHRDYHREGHGKRVARYAEVIGRAIGLNFMELERLRWAAVLHDVGKLNGPFADILSKRERLTDAEYAFVKTHTTEGANLVEPFSHLRDLAPVIRAHHENWDGSGYPDGLAGKEIPLEARILRIADSIDTVLVGRPYQARTDLLHVRGELQRYAGLWYDPGLIQVVLSDTVWAQISKLHAGEHHTDPVLAREHKWETAAAYIPDQSLLTPTPTKTSRIQPVS